MKSSTHQEDYLLVKEDAWFRRTLNESEFDQVVSHVQKVDMASIFGSIEMIDEFQDMSLHVTFVSM